MKVFMQDSADRYVVGVVWYHSYNSILTLPHHFSWCQGFCTAGRACPLKSSLHHVFGVLAGFEEAGHFLCFLIEVLLFAADAPESLELRVRYTVSGGGWVAGAV